MRLLRKSVLFAWLHCTHALAQPLVCRDSFSLVWWSPAEMCVLCCVEMCAALCEGQCLNGGSCDTPDTCVCQQGFTGKRCETGKTQLGQWKGISCNLSTGARATTKKWECTTYSHTAMSPLKCFHIIVMDWDGRNIQSFIRRRRGDLFFIFSREVRFILDDFHECEHGQRCVSVDCSIFHDTVDMHVCYEFDE